MAIETALINKCKRELIKMTNLWIVTMGYEVCRLEQTLSCGPIKLIFDWLVGTFLAKGNNLNQMNITNEAKTKRALWPTLRSSLTVKKLLNFLKLKSNFMHQLIMKCPLWESKIYLLLSLYYYISSIRIKINTKRERLVNEINILSDEMLNKLQKYEDECKLNVNRCHDLNEKYKDDLSNALNKTLSFNKIKSIKEKQLLLILG